MPGIDEYKTVPLKLTPASIHCHTIYIREHFIRTIDPEKPKARTLFLLNVPPYITEENFQEFFSNFGKVERVFFTEKPGKDENTIINKSRFLPAKSLFKFKVGYVVFKKEDSIKLALNIKSIDLFDKTGNTKVVSGMDKWIQEYKNKYVAEDVLQYEIDQRMKEYDAAEKLAHENEKTTVNDDGWVTVGRSTGFEQKESVINKLEEKMKKDKKTKELKNFYTFQIRESKMQHIVNLRQKFEEDKKKIEILKQGRRFKPF